MAPQPFSRTPAVNYAFGSTALAVRPDHAALVAIVIAGWSATEAHLGHVFGVLIAAKTPAAMSMYSAMRSFDAQRLLLQSTAREILSVKYYDIFEAILEIVTRAADIRHKFAHGIWGSSQDLQDAIFIS